jgi:hypothetical protein
LFRAFLVAGAFRVMNAMPSAISRSIIGSVSRLFWARLCVGVLWWRLVVAPCGGGGLWWRRAGSREWLRWLPWSRWWRHGCWAVGVVAGAAGMTGVAAVAAGLAGMVAMAGMVARAAEVAIEAAGMAGVAAGAAGMVTGVAGMAVSVGIAAAAKGGYLIIMPCEVRAGSAGDPVSVLASAPRPPPITEPHPDKQHRCDIDVVITTSMSHRCRWRGHRAIPG